MVYAFYFCVGLLSSQKISLYGEVFVGEILCCAFLLFNMKSIRIPASGKTLLGLLFVWFVAQLAADIINQTEFVKVLKGVLVPVFVAIILLGLTTTFYRRYQYLPLYLLGVFVGLWLSRAMGSELYEDNPWKWGLGSCVALCFFTWIEFYCKSNQKFYLLGGTAVFVAICMVYSSRAMAVIMLAACILAVFSVRVQRLALYRYLGSSPTGVFQFIVLILLAVFLIDRSAAALFSFGPFLELLPFDDAMKYSVQAESKWGVILGGRTELLVSLEAVFDAPIFGHGSWAENSYYVYFSIDRVAASGGAIYDAAVMEANINSFLIPTHSYLMGAIVWGGFFAGLFWLKVLGMSLSGFLNFRVISSPLCLYIAISLIWSILFSPFGADARWMSTVLLWVYITMSANTGFNKGLKA
jgi:hypothetical protein